MITEPKKSIRPNIELKPATTATEQFQNDVLRPILKLQHPILLRLFMISIQKKKVTLQKVNSIQLSELIITSTQKDIVFKNQLLGTVIGQFTENEFEQYAKDVSEYNKRILNMIRKRFMDSEIELRRF